MSSKVETVGSLMDTFKLIIALLICIAAIAAFYIYADQSLLYRVIGLLVAAGIATAIALQTAKGQNIWGFFQAAQVEVKKVVWPTYQETLHTTFWVAVVVLLVAIFLWLLDMGLHGAIGYVMGQRG